ncbi:MAG: DUF2220 domain-containing protein [Treponema sp.]|nr:DUF2220 domain-containing protein [Treponema sp.]
MIDWKNKIIHTLIDHYFASTEIKKQPIQKQSLRLRTSILFPNFDTARHEEKVSYLEAAEFLEQKGIVTLRWEKRRKGERLGTITCDNFEALFAAAGKSHPDNEIEKIKLFISKKITIINNSQNADNQINIITILEYLKDQFSSKEIGQGLNLKTIDELIRFLEFSANNKKNNSITIRALSILLYNDSKHLEHILNLCSPLLTRLQKAESLQNFILSLDVLSAKRSYPDAMISGKLIFEIKNSNTPLVNAEGLIINFPLESAESISSIKPLTDKEFKTVLTIENKETFYALGSSKNNEKDKYFSYYDCILYTGGYPNNAVTTLIKILASSGFSFYHAGDIDPDGILILQNIQEIINSVCLEKSITPIKMDITSFEKYRKWARPLSKDSLNQIKKIRNEIKNISGLADIIKQIEETGLGIEQEIIDYR